MYEEDSGALDGSTSPCGHRNPPSAHFCDACGVRLPMLCRSTGRDTETLRFQRLEHVRARRRARRRYRLLLIPTLVIALVGASLLTSTSIRRTSFERLGSPGSSPPVEMLKPAAALPVATGSVVGPASAVVPPPTPVEPVSRDATQPPRKQSKVDRRARPMSNSYGRDAVAPSRDEPREAEAVDPTAVIDWLLNTSRTQSH